MFSDAFINTIGVDYKTKDLEIEGGTVTLQVWDLAGDFGHITSSFYRGAAGVFVLFDVGNKQSFENIQEWITAVQRFASEKVVTFLIGARCDVKREVTTEMATEFANKEGVQYFETSAKEATNVSEAFSAMAKQIYQVKKLGEAEVPKTNSKPKHKHKKKCPVQ